MTSQNVNLVTASLIIQELVRCGVAQFIITPGSRSTPLVLAAADHAQSVVHYDERGAAFYAVGYGKTAHQPAVLICTSGTAVANYYPAIIEASLSCIPLILLTSDRPVELRDTGAPQAMNQVRIFGSYLRWSFDLPGFDEAIHPEMILTTIDQGYYRACRTPQGPVQINVMFREPFTPDKHTSSFPLPASLQRWQTSKKPYTEYSAPNQCIQKTTIDRIIDKIQQAQRGIIIAGYLPVRTNKGAFYDCIQKLQWPLFADITSGLRFHPDVSQLVLTHYDSFLRNPEFRKQVSPDLILHFGNTPVSKYLLKYIQESRTEYIHVAHHPYRIDPHHMITERCEADAEEIVTAISAVTPKSGSAILSALLKAEACSRELILQNMNTGVPLTEYAIANVIGAKAPPNSGLYLANSMPVRDADGFMAPASEAITVSANRGVNGIDGTISTAAGFAAGLQQPVTVIMGDLAFLHDMNALTIVHKSKIPLIIILINNNGGGIFSFLPIAEYQQHFEQYFGTPHGMSFQGAAELFAIPYRNPQDIIQLQNDYADAVHSGMSTIIEIRSDRVRNAAAHKQLWESICKEVSLIPPAEYV